MKLIYSSTSPYARKVRAVLIEKAMVAEVELIEANPLGEAHVLRQVNPLGKVPTLVLDDGRAVFDSPVICEHLDGLTTNPRLVPSDPEGRLAVLTRQALADGVMDAAFSLVMERRRPEAQRSPEWSERWTGAIRRSLPGLTPNQTADSIDLGGLAAACALGYLDFRLPDLGWRASAPELAEWFGDVSVRQSLASTTPPSS